MRDALRSVFDNLPAITALVLASLGLSLIFLPRELKALEQPRFKSIRWGMAALFLAIGVLAFASDKSQRAEEKSTRTKLEGDIAKLKRDIESALPLLQQIAIQTGNTQAQQEVIDLRTKLLANDRPPDD